MGEAEDNPDAIKYFIRTFKRFARRYLLLDNLTTNSVADFDDEPDIDDNNQ